MPFLGAKILLTVWVAESNFCDIKRGYIIHTISLMFQRLLLELISMIGVLRPLLIPFCSWSSTDWFLYDGNICS